MAQFINLTPHSIVLNDGTSFAPSGTIARVSSQLTKVSDLFFSRTYGDITGLPDAQDDTFYIVSGLVKNATDRKDVVAPATDHSDVVRNDKGHILSVPGFIL
jgi:hypothetical protein